ncbi:MAG: efflux transporter periplasmic adaptor subunit, partial [Gammaproteobacteria bacterium]
MNRQTMTGVLAALVLGAAGGYWGALQFPGGDRAPAGEAGSPSGEREVLFYRNPMNPEITSPVPAQDEMGMDYIPVYAEEEAAKPQREVLFYRNPMNPEIT